MFLTLTRCATTILLPALAFAAAVPAQARDGRNYDRRGNGDDAAIAIGAGLVGLALGAAIASSNRDRDYYYDDDDYYNGGDYYPRQGYYYGAYPRYQAHPSYGYPRGYRRDWRGPQGGYGWHRDGRRHDGWRGNRRNWRY